MTGWFSTARGREAPRLKLGRLLGEGAAGKVHAVVGQRGVAAKIYHYGERRQENEKKVDAMLARLPELPAVRHEGIAYPQLAWPQAKLYDEQGMFAGFLMPEIDFGRSNSLVNLLQRSSRRAEGLSDYYGYRLLVARNFASVVTELHRAGHHMIDMKPANLRFYPAVSWIAVVDTDGFSIAAARKRIAAHQVSDEYVAPEGWSRQPSELGEAQDRFAMAAIVFQLLNNGLHPFSGVVKDGQPSDIQGRIQAGLYPYALRPVRGVATGMASIHRSFRRSTRELFDRAFMAIDDRPSALEWRDHLDGLLGMLMPCAAKPDEHAHFGGGCGFCAQEARMVAAANRPARRPAPRSASQPRGVAPGGPVPYRTGPGMPARIPAAVLHAGSRVRPHGIMRPVRPARGSMARYMIPLGLAGLLCAATIQGAWDGVFAGSSLANGMFDNASPEQDVAEMGGGSSASRAAGLNETPVDLVTVGHESVADPCAGQIDWVRRKLCMNPALAAIDDVVATRFGERFETAPGGLRKVLTEEHDRWMGGLNKCALTLQPDACLQHAYRARIRDLSVPSGT